MSDDTADGADFVAEHLTAARVFRKYGLCDKAWDEYVTVLERFPDNREANQELLTLDYNTQAHTRAMIKKITGRDFWPW